MQMYSLSTYNNNRFYEAAKLKVDPMADKYPSTSPYAYCANNPIILVDPDGEDYEAVVDEENKTITITAVYYASNDNKDKLQEGVNACVSFPENVSKQNEKVLIISNWMPSAPRDANDCQQELNSLLRHKIMIIDVL